MGGIGSGRRRKRSGPKRRPLGDRLLRNGRLGVPDDDRIAPFPAPPPSPPDWRPTEAQRRARAVVTARSSRRGRRPTATRRTRDTSCCVLLALSTKRTFGDDGPTRGKTRTPPSKLVASSSSTNASS